MILLTIGVAILDTHTRLTHLETSAPLLLATISTADDVDLVHPTILDNTMWIAMIEFNTLLSSYQHHFHPYPHHSQ
jgi:hypothetical protein